MIVRLISLGLKNNSNDQIKNFQQIIDRWRMFYGHLVALIKFLSVSDVCF